MIRKKISSYANTERTEAGAILIWVELLPSPLFLRLLVVIVLLSMLGIDCIDKIVKWRHQVDKGGQPPLPHCVSVFRC
jgi:hypothetical protein